MEIVTMKNRIYYLKTSDGYVPVEIKEGAELNGKIYWSFLNVSLSNSNEEDSLNEYIKPEYVGSTHFFGDEGFVFNKNSLDLACLFLYVPEKNLPNNISLEQWLKVKKINGGLYLKKEKKFTSISPNDYRYLSPCGNFLFCISNDDMFPTEGVQISLNERLSLLFNDGKYCGFILINPIRSLVRFEEGDKRESPGDLDIDISSILPLALKYFQIIEEKNWVLLEDKNEGMKNELISIKDELLKITCSEPVYALKSRCVMLLEDYFD